MEFASHLPALGGCESTNIQGEVKRGPDTVHLEDRTDIVDPRALSRSERCTLFRDGRSGNRIFSRAARRAA